MAILLAVAAAIGWGASDFFGGDASRRDTSVFVIVALSELLGVLLLLPALVVREVPSPNNPRLLFAAVAGTAVTSELGLIYRALSRGNAFITAPERRESKPPLLPRGLRSGFSRRATRRTRRLCLATRRDWSVGATDLPANTRPELKDDTCGADQLPIRRVVLCFDRGRLDVQKRAVRKSTAQLARLLVNAGILDRVPD
jgi:hypothetical protein